MSHAMVYLTASSPETADDASTVWAADTALSSSVLIVPTAVRAHVEDLGRHVLVRARVRLEAVLRLLVVLAREPEVDDDQSGV